MACNTTCSLCFECSFSVVGILMERLVNCVGLQTWICCYSALSSFLLLDWLSCWQMYSYFVRQYLSVHCKYYLQILIVLRSSPSKVLQSTQGSYLSNVLLIIMHSLLCSSIAYGMLYKKSPQIVGIRLLMCWTNSQLQSSVWTHWIFWCICNYYDFTMPTNSKCCSICSRLAVI